jgi:anti-sigma B factor antagonist
MWKFALSPKRRSDAMARQITVDQETCPGVLVAHAQKKYLIDLVDIDELGKELFTLIEGKDKPQLIFSLREVTFLSSRALVKVMQLHKGCKTADGQLIMCDIHPDIYEVFRLTRLDRLFNLDPDLATALKRFTTPAPA